MPTPKSKTKQKGCAAAAAAATPAPAPAPAPAAAAGAGAGAGAGAAAAATTDILSATSWSTTKAYRSVTAKETQLAYYTRMKSAEPVLRLVQLDSKPFGSEAEKILCEIFSLGKRTSTQNDGTRNGKKIEIKSARFWVRKGDKEDCKWQHLEPDHDYDIVLFALLNFHGWDVWALQKKKLMGPLRDAGVVKKQGKQGFWAKKSALLPHLTPIRSLRDLDAVLAADE